MKGYIYLAIAVLGEVLGITMIKLSQGLTILPPIIGIIIGYALSFYSLSLSLKTIPLSLAYSIWAGSGTAITVIIGILIWNEPFTSMTFLGLFLIISGIVFLSTANTNKEEKKYLEESL